MLDRIDLRAPNAEELLYQRHLWLLLNGANPDWFARTIRPHHHQPRPELSKWQQRLVADYLEITKRREMLALPPVGQEPTIQDDLPFDPVESEEG